ncbi:MAG: hypothetical protein Q8922_01885 [Bacteroidota bacterium]|nr:hypothetical protein [Bacteroidota bacterium]MDP4232022.1 hypothetical protein [Bacteroidota bacterium]MDP4241271.1 hypothetical protein [Bacteroidota bacterium]MDP4286663.1 hypothetical protein [Bacteroidota bacterium]
MNISLCLLLVSGTLLLSACSTNYRVVESAPDVISWDSLRHSVTIQPPKPVVHPGKVVTYEHFLFISDPYKGWYVIDNTSSSSPRGVAYIAAPGSLDGSVNHGYFYINNSTDLVVLDISDPSSPKISKRLQNVLRVPAPPRTMSDYHNSGAVIGWHDTLVIVPISPLG